MSNEALRFRPMAPVGITAKPSSSTEGAGVYVPDGARAVRTAIRTGVSDGTMTEVMGLAPGREVIIDVARGKGQSSAGGLGRGP